MLIAEDLTLSYGTDVALMGASIAVEPGQAVALTGPSGSGKTSLLYCLSGLLVAQAGSVFMDGIDLSGSSVAARSRVRRERCGFVFQFAELVPELSLLENVELPLLLQGARRSAARPVAMTLLERLGIAAVAKRRSGEVSGGQAQRAAVARAVIHSPAYIFADEPTGSLDTESGSRVLELLLNLAAEQGSALVIVTHDPNVAARMHTQFVVGDGRCSPAAT